MKNTTFRFCKNYFRLLDFVASAFESLSENKINIALIVKNKKHKMLYSSNMFDSICLKFPYMSLEIDQIITNENTGYKNMGACVIHSRKLPKTNCFSELFCFIIQDVSIPINNSSNISRHYHDLQEPLRSISNFLQLLNKQPNVVKNTESVKYISYAMDSIDKLKEWTSEFLLSSMKNPNMSGEERSFQLQDIIEEIKCLLKFQIEKRSCLIDIDKNIPPITSKKSPITSVFKNLIENSLNHAFTHENSLQIKIYQNKEKVTEKNITIIFQDNGDSKRTINNSERYGLGMKIIANMIESVSGHIKNISEDNGYNKFEITLPISLS